MTEYIDRVKLLEVISKNSYDLVNFYNSRNKGMFLEGIEQAIKEQSTINIVHCGECKYHDNNDDSPKWLPCMVIETPKDWFCKDGERMKTK